MPRTSLRRCILSAVVLIAMTVIAGVILTSYTRDDNTSHANKELSFRVNRKHVHLPEISIMSTGTEILLPAQNTSLTSNYLAQTLQKLDSKLLDRFPRFMIIGFGKTGTKALYEALKLHPKLNGPNKEQRFFSRHFSMGVKTYLSAFPAAPKGGYTIEKSPDYIINGEAPGRLLSTTHNFGIDPSLLKFIVVLRDPVDRAVSEYLEWDSQRSQQHKPKLPPFVKMIFDKNGDIDTSLPFLNSSCYVQHIKHWLHYFSKGQLCFVDGDKFVYNPYAEVHQLEECLGLNHYFAEQNFVYDKRKGFYCFRNSQKNSEPLCMNRSKGRKHPDLSESVLDRLTKYFQPCNAKITELTGRTFHLH